MGEWSQGTQRGRESDAGCPKPLHWDASLAGTSQRGKRREKEWLLRQEEEGGREHGGQAGTEGGLRSASGRSREALEEQE